MHLNFNNVGWIPPQSQHKTELQGKSLCQPGQTTVETDDLDMVL